MAKASDQIASIIKLYVRELQKNNIDVKKAILFGSYARGLANENSDIDVAIISDSLSGNRFDDRRILVPLRRTIDSRIEPMPFKSKDFSRGGNLIDEIKETGINIPL
mgnify:FL=1